jgi:ribonuclease HII
MLEKEQPYYYIIFLLLVNYSSVMQYCKNSAVIVGVDEAGRGALAGPVVAGACVLPEGVRLPPFICDSKELHPERRERAYEWIISHCVCGTGIASHDDVDTNGILTATEKAMQLAVAAIAHIITPTYLLIDGRDKFWFDYPHSAIIGGDASEPCISAASIVAKVTRDRLMVAHARTFPCYDFEEHKGYGTPQHIDLIRARGPGAIHRHTFLMNILPPEPPPTVVFSTRGKRRRVRAAA